MCVLVVKPGHLCPGISSLIDKALRFALLDYSTAQMQLDTRTQVAG